jgi:hypothetical protein
MLIFLAVSFVIVALLAYIILRTEVLMADFSKLTAAVDALTVEVDLAVAKLGQAPVEDPAVQAKLDTAAGVVNAQATRLAEAVTPSHPPPSE